MSRFNTGNPLGSGDPRDLDDNAKNMDLAVNSDDLSWRDRFGRDRKSFEGMEQEFADAQGQRSAEFEADQAARESEFESAQNSREVRFNDFIAASGYQFAGDYGPGIEITEYNQLVRDEDGEFWRVSGQVELPYTTTGAGIPEDDALVPAGDAVLRQNLANPLIGAAIVGYKQVGPSAVARNLLEKLIELPSVKDFGAVGDGVTDDTESILKALLYSRDTGYRPLVPPGTFMVRASSILIDATEDKQVIGLSGAGEASVIKMFDGEIISRFRPMFLVRHNDYEDIVVHFDNLLVDNNASGSPAPSNPYEYEQSHTFQNVGSGSGSFAHVLFENVVINDPAADGFQNASYRCKRYTVKNCEARNRTRVRSDIQFSVFPENFVVDGFKGHSIEAEPVGPTTVPIKAFLSNIEVENLDYGIGSAQPEGSTVFINNAHIKNFTYLNGVVFKVSNSVLSVGNLFEGRWGNLRRGSTVTNSEVRLTYDEVSNKVYGLDARACNVEFDNVRFVIDSDDPDIRPVLHFVRGGLLGDESAASTSGPEIVHVVRNCFFDNRAKTSIGLFRNSTWVLKDNDYGGWSEALLSLGGGPGYRSKILVDGGDFSRVEGYSIVALPNASGDPIKLQGLHLGAAAARVRMESGSILTVNLVSSRRIQVTADHEFGTGFKGDILEIFNPVRGAPTAWVCTQGGEGGATFRMLTQAGVDTGPAGNRPAVTGRDAGCQYLDTSLSVEGKPIWWTGTAWVDSSGTAV